MYRYSFIIPVILVMGVFFLTSIAISYAGDNITKPDFMINLDNMDPIERAGGGSTGGGVATLKVLIANITGLLLFMIPLIAVVSLIIAGYFYVFSFGDSEKVGRAKKIILYNTIAIIVAFLSLGIVKLIAEVFNNTSTP